MSLLREGDCNDGKCRITRMGLEHYHTITEPTQAMLRYSVIQRMWQLNLDEPFISISPKMKWIILTNLSNVTFFVPLASIPTVFIPEALGWVHWTFLGILEYLAGAIAVSFSGGYLWLKIYHPRWRKLLGYDD